MTVTAVMCSGLSKSFEGVPVLTDVSLTLMAGTVNILAGENGAGKSTLMKIISGQLDPDRGTVSIFGETVKKFEPSVAQAAGITIIPQELMPVPDMTVYENLLLGREKVYRSGFLDKRGMIEEAKQLLNAFGMDHVDVRTRVRNLSVAMVQLIEIIKATTRNARIILMDEPTSSISEREISNLLDVVRRLRRQGVCIIYTTHKMQEIEQIADNVVILRDGQLVSIGAASEYTEASIVEGMIGRQLVDLYPTDHVQVGEQPVLEVQNIQLNGVPFSNSITVRKGEIIGLAGLVGAGRSEFLEAIFGIRPAIGKVSIEGEPMHLGRPTESIKKGISFVPEDRKLAGLILPLSIMDNITLPSLTKFISKGIALINQTKRKDKAIELARRVNLKYHSIRQSVSQLSGGNQQKIVLAKWLNGDMKVLLLDEPTRGIDVGARAELYKIIVELAERGIGVVMASSDMNEVINLSHRVIVFRHGKIVGEVQGEEATQDHILQLAMGL